MCIILSFSFFTTIPFFLIMLFIFVPQFDHIFFITSLINSFFHSFHFSFFLSFSVPFFIPFCFSSFLPLLFGIFFFFQIYVILFISFNLSLFYFHHYQICRLCNGQRIGTRNTVHCIHLPATTFFPRYGLNCMRDCVL